ncbi:MAG: Undecaprenyl-phosphate 4-deoxy-4-formamido-L-arabinose transferase [Chloroflexi bacterium ADurb.Bin325]|nr:MAG: Undecaprenyl-phosphate 4-deoxy-4-formamido-L-arabinose transferase [Chloroflexi bacterium ADurb.Bin325]
MIADPLSSAAAVPPPARPAVSVLIPAHNEAGNVVELVARVGRALAACGLGDGRGELVFVDDGSTDGTGDAVEQLVAAHPFLRVIRHRRNRGLTAALRTGFRAVRGDLILFLPADLESDPETDIPLLLAKLDEGYDVVSGWRQGRKEGKVFASAIYNLVSRWLFGLRLHDMNWIKGFRREVIESLPPLRADWHRFLVHIAAHQGYRVGEVPTPWRRRKSGRSKFGLSRIPKSLLDVLVVWFLLTFSRAPMRFFGGLGLAALLLSAATFLGLLWLWLAQGAQRRPFFWAAIGLAIAGLILFLIGFIAELVVSQAEQLAEVERLVREERLAGERGRDDRGGP